MLIIYAKADGTVLDISGTSSRLPIGPPDDLAFLNTDAAGHDRSTVELLRLHDQDDAEQVALALTRKVRVEAGRVVDDGPFPEPAPQPDPDADLVAAVTAATTLAQLKDALIGKGRPSAVRGRPTA